MAVTLHFSHKAWITRNDTVKRSERTLALHYIGLSSSADDDDAVKTQAIATSPATEGDTGELIRGQVDVQHVTETITGRVWDVTVNYVHPDSEKSEDDPENTDGDQRSFSTGGGTTHVVSGRGAGHAAKFPAGVAPDHGGLINVREGGVDGVDIVAPNLTFQITRTMPAATVDPTYHKTLGDLTGTVNNGAFKTFAAGEVLFLGANGSQKSPKEATGGAGDWVITYEFAVSKNEAAGTAAGIAFTNKKGWQYLWVYYKETKDNAAVPPVMVKKPVAVYLEDVYEYTDFSAIGIGT